MRAGVRAVLFVHPDNGWRDILFILFDDKNSVMKGRVWEFGRSESGEGNSESSDRIIFAHHKWSGILPTAKDLNFFFLSN